jgi:hypothetical protein
MICRLDDMTILDAACARRDVRMRKGILVLVIVGFAFPALASQSGHPLDCSDWVFLEPGLTCTVLPTDSGVGQEFFSFGPNKETDNTGAMIVVRTIVTPGGDPTMAHGRTEIVRMASGSESVLAYVEDRESVLADRLRSTNLISFDAINGRLLIPLQSFCRDMNYSFPPDCPGNYGGGSFIMMVNGLPSLFEILQTYTPTADALQLRVPAHPEGFRSADHFDTYWGHVSDLPDFTQAQPMQCHYPATTPAAGDFLTVADTSPAPTPGAANYTVTAVTYGSQRRYGRKLINGVMSGRDPALLPGCP